MCPYGRDEPTESHIEVLDVVINRDRNISYFPRSNVISLDGRERRVLWWLARPFAPVDA
jgi:hypothetical protein